MQIQENTKSPENIYIIPEIRLFSSVKLEKKRRNA